MKTSHKPHIYLVDDDESVRKALKRLLTVLEYQVDVFSSAQSFLDAVPTDSEGVLILDVLMPDMNGHTLQDQLNSLRYRLKIIFITAHAQASERDIVMKKGAHGFLQKPFDEKSLIELIQSAFKK